MGFNPDISAPSPQHDTEKLALALACLRQGQNAQAFLILSRPDFDKEPAAQFALALCYLRADEFSAAAARLEQALRLARALPAARPNAAENTDTYIKLFKGQLEDEFYLTPLDTDFCTLFPRETERIILLTLIHAYRKQGMDEKARQLSSGLSGAVFEQYKKHLFEKAD